MYYLVHLTLPAIAVLIMVISGNHIEWNLSELDRAIEHFSYLYMALASPLWIWAAISGYFEASKGVTVGGFVGEHLLMLCVWLLVSLSSAPEAPNGWFLYFLGSPIAITIGALAGKHFCFVRKLVDRRLS